MKYIFMLIILFALSGCNLPNSIFSNDNEIDFKDATNGVNVKAKRTTFKATCLDGVQYWIYRSKMSVRIDPETLKPKRCVGSLSRTKDEN